MGPVEQTEHKGGNATSGRVRRHLGASGPPPHARTRPDAPAFPALKHGLRPLSRTTQASGPRRLLRGPPALRSTAAAREPPPTLARISLPAAFRGLSVLHSAGHAGALSPIGPQRPSPHPQGSRVTTATGGRGSSSPARGPAAPSHSPWRLPRARSRQHRPRAEPLAVS